MKLLKKLHFLSLNLLTLSGAAALAALAVNVISSLVMFAAEALDGTEPGEGEA